MASKTKMGQFLKGRGSNQNEAAKVLGIKPSAFSTKARGFSEKEKTKLIEHYAMSAEEIEKVF